MGRQQFTPEQVALLLNNLDTSDRARIFEAGTQHPFSIQSMVLALDTAKLSTDPLKIGFPFKSLWVSAATDTAVSVDIKVGAKDSFQSTVPLKKNDAFQLDSPTSEAYLSWSAQSGKSVTIVFFVNANFMPGSQIAVQSGGVTVSEGSAVGAIVSTNLAAATATIIVPALSTRIVANVQNKTGGDLYISGTSAVTDDGTLATAGIKWPADAIFQWRNTGALYGYSVAGGRVNYFEEA